MLFNYNYQQDMIFDYEMNDINDENSGDEKLIELSEKEE